MNIDHIKYFIDAAQAGGVSQAARRNYLTQSAISRAIAKLEEDLGVELVLHKQNRFQLTEVGEVVFAKGLEILESINHLKDIALEQSQTHRGPLRIGCNQAIASRILATKLHQLEQQNPLIRPDIKLGNTDQVQQMLDRQEIDFGIVMNDGEVIKNYKLTPIFKDEFIVVRAPTFSADPFMNLIVSRTHRGGMSQTYFREYEKHYGRSITPKLVIASWQVIMDMALAGLGAALVPRFLCHDLIQRKLLMTIKHKVKPIPFELCVIVSKGRELPRNAIALISLF